MLVGRGSLSFRTFEVSGKNPTPSHQLIVNRLEKFAFAGIKSREEGAVTGWVGPEHLFDGDFNAAKIFRGQYAVFAFRVDTLKVPGNLIQAHTAVAIQAEMTAEGVEKLSGKRKREIKLDIKHQLLEEIPPTQRAYGVFWNVQAKKLYLQNTSKTIVEHFRALVERSFDIVVEPQVPGLKAANHARDRGTLQALKDARPVTLDLRPELALAV